MKTIAISMGSRFISECVLTSMKRTGDFRPVRIPSQNPEEILIECKSEQAEVLLMDVAPASRESALTSRIKLAESLRREVPGCKIALLCDETLYPELAREVMWAKYGGQIDAFFYASVTPEYLMASLLAL